MWSKGHTPNIEDPLIQDAVKKYNMMDTGFNIKPGDMRAVEVEMINMLKSQLNRKQLKQMTEMTV